MTASGLGIRDSGFVHAATPARSALRLDCAGKSLDLSAPIVMGILNLTPDSFSDGGRFLDREAALAQARRMVEEGAAIIDVGGESTRPGATPVTVEAELARVVPVIEALARELKVPISIDTRKPEVMRAAIAAGAGFINDVAALRETGALAAAAELGVPVCLMHMQGEPATMQSAPHYDDVVNEVRDFLAERIAACEDAGIPRERIVLDPGFGFGKTLEHNLELFRNLDCFGTLGPPLLIGVSRKGMLGAIVGGAPVEARLHAGLAAAVMAAQRGARIIRTHDVAPTVEALRFCQAAG